MFDPIHRPPIRWTARGHAFCMVMTVLATGAACLLVSALALMTA